jgi:hypothetical protein
LALTFVQRSLLLEEFQSHIFEPQLLPASNAGESHRALVIGAHLKAIVSALWALEVAHVAVPSAKSRIDRDAYAYPMRINRSNGAGRSRRPLGFAENTVKRSPKQRLADSTAYRRDLRSL